MFSIESDIEKALKHFPKLVKQKDKYAVTGELDIIHPKVGYLDSFEVLIEFPKGYPFSLNKDD